jgi:hypothetical protein
MKTTLYVVPVTLFILDSGHFIHQVCPGVDSQDFDTLQLKVIEIQKQFGVDVFVRLLHGIYDPIAIRMAGLEVTEALGGAAFIVLALGTLVAAGATLQNALPLGSAGMLLSAGTIPVGNVAVGVEVAGGVALVLAEFLERALQKDPT